MNKVWEPERRADPVAVLRDAATIRERCAAISRHVSEGRSPHFKIDRSRLEAAAARVEQVTRGRYPTLNIPYHSRWRHFEAGNIDRAAELDHVLASRNEAQKLRSRIDLTVVSVLLDAGAGGRWRYHEAETGQSLARSEGLGVATFRAFMRGVFSCTDGEPARVDAAVLQGVDAAALGSLFQVRDDNPLVGLDGRAALLNRLGDVLIEQSRRTGLPARPGVLYDLLTDRGERRQVPAARVLRTLLDSYSPIWPSGQTLDGQPIGDVWPHPAADGSGPAAGWVPFHKLSQWLSYSLLEPFEWAGVQVTGLDSLTALPEYRNGGLLIDTGVIVPRDVSALQRRYGPGDEFVVEWRALTVSLMDELAPIVRTRLGLSAPQLPLACMLEGGTWAAGRQTAQALRRGAPPFEVDSDGTIF